MLIMLNENEADGLMLVLECDLLDLEIYGRRKMSKPKGNRHLQTHTRTPRIFGIGYLMEGWDAAPHAPNTTTPPGKGKGGCKKKTKKKYKKHYRFVQSAADL